jgi:eukaryotic-like serine/threonine-protein kinase
MNREPGSHGPLALPSRLAEWPGTSRYRVRRCIGTGAVGAVYEAFDGERDVIVALKKLRHFSPATLYLFKQEFRTLADVHHPNLVRLYELVATEDREVFFTMELVRGPDIVAHVRRGRAVDFDRLRDALRQLVLGVQALHAAGKLHRDIKPSNVLVTPEGRVVLLDFGVAIELARAGDDPHEDQAIVGTASYMAPEQAAGAAPTPASDWYGVGAILFEALVGSAPFLGSVADVLRMKSSVTPPLPSACGDGVPPDLDTLCGALLQRAPEARPTAIEILRLLGGPRSEHSEVPAAPAPEPGGSTRLMGRQDQLVALRAAFDATRKGRSVTVRVRGPSGMGKSSLVQVFLDGLVAAGEAVVLRGRAYERESVPYKAIDGWVDALSRHLMKLSDRAALALLPKDIWALARLFPVLRRVPAIGASREPFVGDPHRMRRQAFAALRELLASLAGQAPVVVYVDDVHWGDSDSAALLLDLVRPPQAPSLLLVMTYREDEGAASPLLSEMSSQWPQGAEERDVTVGPLAAGDAAQLARVLLGSGDDAARAMALAIAEESDGSPFLVEELVRIHQAREASEKRITLDESVAERVGKLPDPARRLLEVVAVGGRPLPVSIVGEAAGTGPDSDDPLSLLRSRRFVRVGLRNGHEVVETTHDRIREAIVGLIPAARAREHHGRLAIALESTPDPDPEAVAIQLLGAGEKERAGPYAERAAERAIAKLAFDRAVQLFRLALEGTAASSPDLHRLRLRLAEALSLAGRGAEAARIYLDAAAADPGAGRVELERAAAAQLLVSGRIDEGARVLHRVLAAIRMKAPGSTLSALFWLVAYRLRLAVMGLRFEERRPEKVRPHDRARIEAMYAVAMGFAVVDVLLGACMQARLLILSLRAGDRSQILRAVALEAAQRATLGGQVGKRERDLFEFARRLPARTRDVESEAFLEGTLGVALFLRGRWKEAREALDSSNAKLPSNRSQWHTNGNLFAVRSLYFSGEIKELVRRQARVFADAQDRGDLYTLVNFAATTTITTHLAADDPEGARRQAREGMAQWSQTGFLVQHWQAMAFEPDIDLYIGDGGAAYDRLMRDLPALRRSLLLNVQFVRSLTHYTLGRCAVASIQGRPRQRRARIAEARRDVRRLEREQMPWTAVLAAVLAAATENAAGDHAGAVAALRRAVEAAESAGMGMHATAARYRLGQLAGGEEGAALLRSALEALEAEGIRDASRWVAIYLPGAWEARGS